MTYDSTAPTVTVNQAGAQADPTNVTPINFDVVFSEAINPATFTAADITQNGTSTGITWTITNSGDNINFTLAATVVATNGTVVPSISIGTFADAGGNTNTAASTSTDNSVTYNSTAPTVTVNQAGAQADPTNATPINFDVVFSEAINPATFTAADITQNGTSTGITWTITNSGDNINFTLAATVVTTNGTVVPSISIGTFADAGGNTNTAASTSTDNSVTYDTINPIVTSTDLIAGYTGTGPGSFIATFSKSVDDPAGNTSTNDATNPANYLLVNKGANGTANTVSCAGGVVTDDTQVTVTSVSYNTATFKATVTLASALPVGSYRLFICGTTSIVDLAGNHLNGGADYTFDFLVKAAQQGGGVNGNGGSSQLNSLLPATGFPQDKVTILPIQSADKAYTSTELWLEIPTIGVKMSIVGVSSTKDNWDVSWLDKNAGWLNGSAFPTWSGNAVLTGHVWDALNRPGPFAQLKTLKYGDRINIHAFGMVYTYEITESSLITNADAKTAFKHEEKSVITLLTCESYKEASNTYAYRRMVRAILVSVTKEK